MSSEEIEFLKKSELFKGLPEETIKKIYQKGKLLEFGPDEFIVKEGDTSKDLYIIKEGVVEIIVEEGKKVIAYLSDGESFGEMALITGDTRSATVRVPERAIIFKLPAEIYDHFLSNDLVFLRRICELLAYRLKKSNLDSVGKDSIKKLYGKLKFFDFPTVLQTISQSKQSGILKLENPYGDDPQIFLFEGNVINVLYRNLEPTEAFNQILIDLEKFTEFLFKEKEKERIMFSKMNKKVEDILLNGLKEKDDFVKILNGLGGENRSFLKKEKNLKWDEENTLECAKLIWILLDEKCSIGEILKGCSNYYSSATTIKVLEKMFEKGLIE